MDHYQRNVNFVTILYVYSIFVYWNFFIISRNSINPRGDAEFLKEIGGLANSNWLMGYKNLNLYLNFWIPWINDSIKHQVFVLNGLILAIPTIYVRWLSRPWTWIQYYCKIGKVISFHCGKKDTKIMMRLCHEELNKGQEDGKKSYHTSQGNNI